MELDSRFVRYLSLASDTGISPKTAQSWLSVLEAGYIIHLVQP